MAAFRSGDKGDDWRHLRLGDNLQRLHQRKKAVRGLPLEKKLEKLAIYTSCKEDKACKCNGWKNPNPRTTPKERTPPPPCQGCGHALSSHVSNLQNVKKAELDKLLGITVDVENLFMCTNKEEDGDTKQVFAFLFKLLRYTLEISTTSVEEFLEAPPQDKPNIAEAISNFVFLRFKHLRPKEWQTMRDLANMFLHFTNHWNLDTPSKQKQNMTGEDFSAYRANYARWLGCCHVPTFCDSLPHYDTTLIFGRSLLSSIFQVPEKSKLIQFLKEQPQPMRKQLLDKFSGERGKMPPERRTLLLNQFPRFLSLLEKEIFSTSSPIWDPKFKENSALSDCLSKEDATKNKLEEDVEDDEEKQAQNTIRTVRLVVEGDDDRPKEECLARRLLPLIVEPGLTLVMALEDSCIACGRNCLACGEPCLALCEECCKAAEANDEQKRPCPDSLSFLQSLESLPKDTRHTYLRVPKLEVRDTLSQVVSCVGCRSSVEALYQTLQQSEGAAQALHPLAITPEGEVFVPENYLAEPEGLARMFVQKVLQLSSLIPPLPESKSGKGKRGTNTRCSQHALTGPKTSLVPKTWSWKETWDNMEDECRESTTMLPKPVLNETIKRHVKKNKFNANSAMMVNRAYSQLIENSQEHAPTLNRGEKTKNSQEHAPTLNRGEKTKYADLYSVISTCIKKDNVHCDTNYVDQLVAMAEPHFRGVKQKHKVENMFDAQNEVLICIGMALLERFQRIQDRIDEGKRACDLLLLVCLKALRQKLEVAAEGVKGEAYLDQLCLEIENVLGNKKGAKKKKRRKETKKKEVPSDHSDAGKQVGDPGASLKSADLQKCFTRSDEEDNLEENKENDSVIHKQTECPRSSPTSLDNHVTLVSAFSSSRCTCPGPSLAQMLVDEENTGGDIEPIPNDVITSFLQSKEKTTELRKELREDLRRRFDDFCMCHNTRYCPERCFRKKL